MTGKRNSKRILICGAIGVMLAMALSACGKMQDEKENHVVVEQEAPAAEYKLAMVTRGDVIKTKSVRCVYSQINAEELSFPVSGKLISKVYVHDGDQVQKGTLLAELSGGSREAEIEQLEYQIARNKLLLEQLDESENYEISRRWLEKWYHGMEYEVDGIENLQKNNNYTRQDYQDNIDFDEQQLALIRADVARSKLYAGIAGTVEMLKKNLEGTTSVRDELIIKIKDNSECFFTVPNTEYHQYIKDGDLLELVISVGKGAGSYKAEPYKMDEWKDQMYFSLLTEDDSLIIDAGTAGMLTIPIDKKEQVLMLPLDAVHSAGDKWYVYIINDQGVREVKWISVGLSGNDTIEVTEGLTEGEKVVLK